jgi:hypothetical protein
MEHTSDRPGWLFTDTVPSSGQPVNALPAAPDLFAALSASSGAVVCRLVDCGCDANNRRLVWAFDATLPLNKFAIQCAKRALAAAAAATGWQAPNELFEALAVKSDWDSGDCTQKDVRAVRENVWMLRQSSGHAGQNRDLASVCIDEALLAVVSAVGVLPVESELNSAWKSAFDACNHCYLVLEAALKLTAGDSVVVDAPALRKPLLNVLEELLISEMTFSELRGAATPRRLDCTPGALYQVGNGDHSHGSH